MANINASLELMSEKELPLQYYSAYSIINKHLPADHILIGEGANTMDIGRTVIMHQKPKHRLDAGLKENFIKNSQKNSSSKGLLEPWDWECLSP